MVAALTFAAARASSSIALSCAHNAAGDEVPAASAGADETGSSAVTPRALAEAISTGGAGGGVSGVGPVILLDSIRSIVARSRSSASAVQGPPSRGAAALAGLEECEGARCKVAG